MAPRTVRTIAALRYKRDEIAKAVAEYERRLSKARADLDHVSGAIALFETTGDIHRLFRRGEAMAICKVALRQGPLSSRQMVDGIVAAKGLDPGDVMLIKAIAARLNNSLVHQQRRGGLVVSGKYRTARLWRLP
jgi:hypothetical protein